jgi:hypothetical protein
MTNKNQSTNATHNANKLVCTKTLLSTGKDVFLHFNPTRQTKVPGLMIPEHLMQNDKVAFQIGLNLPIHIDDLKLDDVGFSATLSFSGKKQFCSVPWEYVYGVVGEDGIGKTWEQDFPNEDFYQKKTQKYLKPVTVKRERPNWLKVVEGEKKD